MPYPCCCTMDPYIQSHGLTCGVPRKLRKFCRKTVDRISDNPGVASNTKAQSSLKYVKLVMCVCVYIVTCLSVCVCAYVCVCVGFGVLGP